MTAAVKNHAKLDNKYSNSPQFHRTPPTPAPRARPSPEIQAKHQIETVAAEATNTNDYARIHATKPRNSPGSMFQARYALDQTTKK